MKYPVFIAFLVCTAPLFAQTDTIKEVWDYPERYRLVSINTTPLLTQLIPFNRSNPLQSGPYNVEFNRFNGNRAFHTSIGVFIVSDGVFDVVENANFNFRIGGTRMKEFSERWTFYRGWDFYFSLGNFNLIGETSTERAVMGMGPRWSIAYRIKPPFSISIETALVIGLDVNAGVPNFQFIPPVALNMNFVLPRSF
ncbi:MAG: hypothetical protein IPN76_11255 [Saprospiraceae bacterium]|nr:hypothetical protein [Saprospiraceae bacterium]